MGEDNGAITVVEQRLREHLDEETARVWMSSANGFLHGETPADWIVDNGPVEALKAFDAYLAGSYA